MKQLSKINLKLILTRIFAVIVFAVAVFGALNFSTVRAEESPNGANVAETIVINKGTRYLAFKINNTQSKSDWVESEILGASQHTFAGKYFRIRKPETSTQLFNFEFTENGKKGYYGVYYNDEVEELYFGRFLIEYISVEYNGESYLEFYMPTVFEAKLCYAEDKETVYHSYFDENHYILWKSPNLEMVFIEEPEQEIFILEQNAEVFKLPNSYNKNDWTVKEIVSSETQKDTYAGRWYRYKKPNLPKELKLFDVEFMTNGEIKTENVSFNLEKEMLTFGRFSIEYNSVVIENDIYFEFYLPETFNQKSCIKESLNTVYHDCFDNTYVITYKNPEADVVFISEPTSEEPSEPEKPDMGDLPGFVWDEFDGNGEDDGDGNKDYNFIEKVGNLVCDVIRIDEANRVIAGWVTVVALGLAVGVTLLVIFKK